MQIAVIGGGLMGTSLAYFLSQQGQQVTLLEQGTDIGSLHRFIHLDENLSIPRYQHYLLPGDRHVLSLIRQLGLGNDLNFYPAHTGFVSNGHIQNTTSPWDVLRFAHLGMDDRLLLINTLLRARLTNDWRSLDKIPVKDWLIQVGGRENFERIWAPLLEAKFDFDYDNVPATFMWSWLNRMSKGRNIPQFRTQIGYLRKGIRSLIQVMTDEIEALDGVIQTETRVREIELSGQSLGAVRTHLGILQFDAVIAALPTPDFARLLLTADETYLESLSDARYLGLVCPALIVDRPLSNFWTLNMSDPSSPFSTIIEQPHPDHPNLHIVYLPKYTAPDHDWMGVPDAAIQEAWGTRLRQLFPALKSENIKHFVVNRSRYVEPVHFLNGASHLSPLTTPYEGLFMVNAGQVYPQLPTADAIVAHAEHAARMIIEWSKQRSAGRVAA